ncbi:MAG: DUF3189 family protein [Thermoanaerobacterium sp.]|nr:DUF3189 family protein [Thermoanaerobacterium sp.]
MVIKLKIVYYSYYGCFSSVVTAYIHTGYLKDEISKDIIFSLPEMLNLDYGELKYIGLDENLHEVYIIGMKNFSDNIKKTLEGLRKIYNLEYDRLIFVDTNMYEPKYFKLIFTIRKITILKKIADKILYNWVIKHLNEIKNSVEEFKKYGIEEKE